MDITYPRVSNIPQLYGAKTIEAVTDQQVTSALVVLQPTSGALKSDI
jgi:hypothetical protein